MINLKQTKGISIMVGYVLLISFAIVVGAIIYKQLKTYIPTDVLECPEGVSMFIKEKACSGTEFNLTFKNNGKFNIGGYFIRTTNSSDQTIATIDLTNYYSGNEKLNPGIVFSGQASGEDFNTFKPDQEFFHNFNLSGADFGTIDLIEIIPFRWQEEDNKKRLVNCGEAKISEKISCT
ncbi:MAG: hypothetical protein KKF48_03540 [Nanoarchaeota archaeon]|nr:hypothetical protein [Nanoarchaeota archaeon]MBU1028093.1 hypothetical protein [Nanoarchaeota archaeon]